VPADTVPNPKVVPFSDSLYVARQREWRKLADSVLGPVSPPDTGDAFLQRYFDARIVMDTATDSATAAAIRGERRRRAQNLTRGPDLLERERDSLRRSLTNAQRLYTSDHPVVRALQSRIDLLSSFRPGGRKLPISPGCSTNEFVRQSAVRLVIDDSAESRAGRVIVLSSGATRSGISVVAKLGQSSVMCHSERAEIRVLGLGLSEDRFILVQSATRTTIDVVTTSGRALVAPVLLENGKKQYELTWPAR
jgi:hypothetical protein